MKIVNYSWDARIDGLINKYYKSIKKKDYDKTKLTLKSYKNKLDMAICDYYIHKNNIIEEKKIYDFGIKNLKDDDSIIYKINYSPWNKIYRKDMLIKHNIIFPDKLKYEDTPFIYKALINSNKIGKLNKYLNHYIVHNNSETTIMDDRVFDILKI